MTDIEGTADIVTKCSQSASHRLDRHAKHAIKLPGDRVWHRVPFIAFEEGPVVDLHPAGRQPFAHQGGPSDAGRTVPLGTLQAVGTASVVRVVPLFSICSNVACGGLLGTSLASAAVPSATRGPNDPPWQGVNPLPCGIL
jgi:hypothetical protein